MSHIHPDIESIARWGIEPCGVYNPFSGVTNNQAEGFNHVLKSLQEWKEAPVDCLALSLHYLQGYYLHEIERGKQGLGEYTLNPQFSGIFDFQAPLYSESVYHPQTIIERIKGTYTHCENEVSSKPTPVSSKLTQMQRARCIIENNKLSFDPRLHTFTIMGTTKPHVVTLFPKETCSCPSTTLCYHIMAAKLSIGEDEDKTTRK